MKKTLLFSLLTLSYLWGNSQITVSKSALTYPKTKYKEVSDQLFDIVNDYSEDIDLVLRSHHQDFYVDDSTVQVKANSRASFTVHFKPTHNINYNTELVIVSTTKSGSFSVDLRGAGEYSAYYNSTFDLYEEDLKSELKSVLSAGYKNLGYSGARDAMYGSIDNKSGKVECVYTGRQATFNTRSGANNNSFNCEHTWPQSLFNQNEPERADIHHLFPTDVNANSRRSNYPFGVVSSATWTEGGSKLGGGVFEPRDAHKGDCARAMFYFAIRYQNYSSFLTNQETTLRNWAAAYPPSQQSIDRNNAIFNYQKNRNPFVDYPEFLDRISSVSTTSSTAKKYQVSTSVSAINISKLSTAGAFTYQLVLTNTGNQTVLFTGFGNGNANVTIPKTAIELSPGSSHYYKINITPTTSVINDVINLTSDNISLSIPLTVTGLSAVPEVTAKSFYARMESGTLKVYNGLNYRVHLIDSKGQEVFFNEIQSDFTEIDLSHIPSGIYFVQAIGKGRVPEVLKILIP